MGVSQCTAEIDRNVMAKIRKVLITGGHEVGGVGSFADGLATGFSELGIPSEVISPTAILKRWRDLRDPSILKILSTTAVITAPFSRRAICICHGIPRADLHGWRKLAVLIGLFKLANACSGIQLVSVSHYTATTMRAIFKIRTDAVIHNPVKPIYLEPAEEPESGRRYITYVGRLIRAKNLHRLIPAIQDLLNENPGMRACIVGNGEERSKLEVMLKDDTRFEFQGKPDDNIVREWLRRTKIFVSGNEMEGFGITYLEALAQGCVVAMPACGGGIEISLNDVGGAVQLLPLSWDRGELLTTLRRALKQESAQIMTERFTVDTAVKSYLRVDSQFSASGTYYPKQIVMAAHD